MTISRLQLAACCAGTMIAIAGITISGCDHNAQPAPQTAGTTTLPPDHPPLASSADMRALPAASASLKVRVSLSPAVAAKAAPNDTVFIFARAVNGPRMPLAIVSKKAKDLPATIVLDDSQEMMGSARLSSVAEVVVVARVSKSGVANAQPGDLEGVSAPVKTSARSLELVIGNVVGPR
jgi:cytochrome c-type biogenesis protein CcmH